MTHQDHPAPAALDSNRTGVELDGGGYVKVNGMPGDDRFQRLDNGRLYALGRTQDSNAALTQLIKGHQCSMAYQIAEIYAYRGRSDKAFDWLNRAYEQYDPGLRSLKIDPLLEGLRKDPRYSDLLRKMRLPS